MEKVRSFCDEEKLDQAIFISAKFLCSLDEDQELHAITARLFTAVAAFTVPMKSSSSK